MLLISHQIHIPELNYHMAFQLTLFVSWRQKIINEPKLLNYSKCNTSKYLDIKVPAAILYKCTFLSALAKKKKEDMI